MKLLARIKIIMNKKIAIVILVKSKHNVFKFVYFENGINEILLKLIHDFYFGIASN